MSALLPRLLVLMMGCCDLSGQQPAVGWGLNGRPSIDIDQAERPFSDCSATLPAFCLGHGYDLSDTGIGMDADIQRKWFWSFTQGDRRIRRRFGGTGQGLAISGRLAELFGGEIRVSCTSGEDSAFRLQLELRNWEYTHDTHRVPIVALTANAMQDDRARCLAVGMDDYQSKPVRQEHLRLMLQRWLVG